MKNNKTNMKLFDILVENLDTQGFEADRAKEMPIGEMFPASIGGGGIGEDGELPLTEDLSKLEQILAVSLGLGAPVVGFLIAFIKDVKKKGFEQARKDLVNTLSKTRGDV